MSRIDCDTKRLENDTKTLLSLNKKYIDYISRIKALASKNDYWAGADGDAFRADLKESCLVYDKVGSILKEYALFLEKYGNEVDNKVSLDIIK